jgi:hypothetical protein
MADFDLLHTSHGTYIEVTISCDCNFKGEAKASVDYWGNLEAKCPECGTLHFAERG